MTSACRLRNPLGSALPRFGLGMALGAALLAGSSALAQEGMGDDPNFAFDPVSQAERLLISASEVQAACEFATTSPVGPAQLSRVRDFCKQVPALHLQPAREYPPTAIVKAVAEAARVPLVARVTEGRGILVTPPDWAPLRDEDSGAGANGNWPFKASSFVIGQQVEMRMLGEDLCADMREPVAENLYRVRFGACPVGVLAAPASDRAGHEGGGHASRDRFEDGAARDRLPHWALTQTARRLCAGDAPLLPETCRLLDRDEAVARAGGAALLRHALRDDLRSLPRQLALADLPPPDAEDPEQLSARDTRLAVAALGRMTELTLDGTPALTALGAWANQADFFEIGSCSDYPATAGVFMLSVLAGSLDGAPAAERDELAAVLLNAEASKRWPNCQVAEPHRALVQATDLARAELLPLEHLRPALAAPAVARLGYHTTTLAFYFEAYVDEGAIEGMSLLVPAVEGVAAEDYAEAASHTYTLAKVLGVRRGLAAPAVGPFADARNAEEHDRVAREAMRTLVFGQRLARATDRDGVNTAVDSYLGDTAWERKRRSSLHFGLNGYVGAGGGIVRTSRSGEGSGALWATAMVGPEISVATSPRGRGATFGLFASALDLGPLAQVRFVDNGLTPQVTLGQLVSPGGYVTFGLPSAPVALYAGAAYTPNQFMRGSGTLEDGWRAGFGVALDFVIID